MPYIDVKLVTGRLNAEREQQLIERITDAVASVFGDDIRHQTWIVLEEVAPARWGIGGAAVPLRPSAESAGT